MYACKDGGVCVSVVAYLGMGVQLRQTNVLVLFAFGFLGVFFFSFFLHLMI